MNDAILPRLTDALAGRYDVVRELGAGGMATVYLADDPKHDRQVAIKVLRPELAAVIGGERFVTEIKTTAALHHPHILPLFDSGESDGLLYYVMPYVEGETLRDRLDRESQLPVADAVKIAAAASSALQYAHDRGVVHRDIKPANILLQAGEPVVADFGIALAISAAGGGRLTETGMSVGTPHYMSPEQASADRDVDRRSDVYSLASVLYEMLAGVPPHTGPNAQSVLIRILTEEPRSLTEVRPAVPEHVRDAVIKGLEKLPADRFESADAFGRALRDEGFRYAGTASGRAAATHPTPASTVSVASGGLVRGLVGGMILLAGLAAWGWLRPSSPPAPTPVTRTFLDVGEATVDLWDEILISPDGGYFAFVGVADPATSTRAVFVRSADELEFRVLPGLEGDVALHGFSPDGRWLLYTTYGRDDSHLSKISVLGGASAPVVRRGGLRVFSADWGEDGTIIFSGADEEDDTRGIYAVSADGGPPTRLTDLPPRASRVRVLPGGGILIGAARGTEGGVAVLDLTDMSTRPLITGAIDTRYVESGHLVYGDGEGSLWAVPFDPSTRTLLGTPSPVLTGVTTTGLTHRFSVSRAGTLVYGVGGRGALNRDRSTLVIVGLDGTETPIDLQPRFFYQPTWSPDGRTVAYEGLEPGDELGGAGDMQVYTYDVTLEGAPRALSVNPGSDGYPVWSPDGDRVVFLSSMGEADDLWIAYLDGRPPFPLGELPGRQIPTDWPSDDVVVFSGGGPRGVYLARLEGDSLTSVETYYVPEASAGGGAVSPAGGTLAYHSNETGRWEVYLRAFPEPGAATRVSVNGGSGPLWSRDGTQLYFRNDTGDTLMVATLEAPGSHTVTSVVPLRSWPFDWPADLHPDGDRFIAVRMGGTADGAEVLPERHVVVHNWFEELRRLSPVRREGGGDR